MCQMGINWREGHNHITRTLKISRAVGLVVRVAEWAAKLTDQSYLHHFQRPVWNVCSQSTMLICYINIFCTDSNMVWQAEMMVCDWKPCPPGRVPMRILYLFLISPVQDCSWILSPWQQKIFFLCCQCENELQSYWNSWSQTIAINFLKVSLYIFSLETGGMESRGGF